MVLVTRGIPVKNRILANRHWLYLLMLFMGSVYAENIRPPQDTLLEVSLTPAEGVVGQKRLLTVTVLTESWFAAPTVFPDLDVVPALVQRQEGFASNFIVRRNGRQYTAQSREYAIFPTAAGRLVIPPLKVSAKVATPGVGEAFPGAEERLLWQSPVVFNVSPLADISASAPVASSLSIRSEFHGPLTGLATGELLARTLLVEASDTLAVTLPEMRQRVPDNIRLYRAPPRLEDLRDRTNFLARRSEHISYVFEKPGTYILPAIEYHWWNSETGQHETRIIEAVLIEVSPSSEIQSGFLAALVALVVVLLMIFSYQWRTRLRAAVFLGLDKLSALSSKMKVFISAQRKYYRSSKLPPLN